MVCREGALTSSGVDGQGKPLRWAWDMAGGDGLKSAVSKVTSDGIAYSTSGVNYELRIAPNTGTFQKLSNDVIRISPNSSGKLVMTLGEF